MESGSLSPPWLDAAITQTFLFGCVWYYYPQPLQDGERYKGILIWSISAFPNFCPLPNGAGRNGPVFTR
jgi:hypothetical protein